MMPRSSANLFSIVFSVKLKRILMSQEHRECSIPRKSIPYLLVEFAEPLERNLCLSSQYLLELLLTK
jgi:hypothetical protein